MAVAVNLEVPATMTALQSIDGFPLHEMKMTVPPFLTTGIRAEPPPFSSGNLLHLLTAAFTNRFRLYRHSCLLPRYRRSAAKRLHSVFGQSDELRDFLVSLALHAKVFYFCFLIVCHRSAPSLQQKGQKYRFLADFPTAIKITSIKEPRQRENFMGLDKKILPVEKVHPRAERYPYSFIFEAVHHVLQFLRNRKPHPCCVLDDRDAFI